MGDKLGDHGNPAPNNPVWQPYRGIVTLLYRMYYCIELFSYTFRILLDLSISRLFWQVQEVSDRKLTTPTPLDGPQHFEKISSPSEKSAHFWTNRVTAEIRERFQQLQNLEQKYSFLRPEVILSMDELNLDQALQDINEFQLECVRLQAFVAATEPGCKKELIRSGSLCLLKYIIESKLEDILPNILLYC
ncbi:uncharacterized protein TNCV_88961 [Trichonephila clavipes]|nr:uncharacterized protein TNCV_88961 [Trichonephila clavipes]